MQKSPASPPKKLERPFVATSTVWDEIRYKPGKGMLLADTQPRVYMNDRWTRWSLFYKVFCRLNLITNLWIFLPQNDAPQKAFYGPQVFSTDLNLRCVAVTFESFFFFLSQKSMFFRPLK